MVRRFVITVYLVCIVTSLWAADAPITSAGAINNAIPGTSPYDIPVTVASFTNIGQFTLTMTFDITRLTYLSSVTNSALSGMSVTYTTYEPYSGAPLRGKLVFSWTGPANVSLTDGSSIATLQFTYLTGSGILSWDYNYFLCQYKRYSGSTLTDLNDLPKYQYYKNGGISNRGAPLTFAPVVTVQEPGAIQLPVTVNSFINIAAFTLYLEYDPGILTYQNSFSKNPVFGSSFVVGNQPGYGGKMVIIIQWYGSSLSLGNGAILCTLNFTYPNPNLNGCALTWIDTGPTCEYSDGQGDILIDMPYADYYTNGSAAPPVAGVTITPSANPVCNGIPVTFTASPSNGGTSPVYQWKVNGTNSGSGGTSFIYTPSNNDLVACLMTSSASFVTGSPATSNAVGMIVNGLNPVNADFLASNLTPQRSEPILLTNLSAGDPISWHWSFDRSSVEYVNGTDSLSENPEVRFTEGGLYTVSLTTSDLCSSDTETKAGYIRAGIDGLWTGATSGEWNVASNWDNELVPGSTTQVVVPSDALQWPVFEGDLLIGIHCGRLTLQGAASRMTIMGDIVIP